MKRGLLLVCFALAPWVKADSLCNFLFNIVIQNQTGEQCRLINQIVHEGNSRSKTIPLVIDHNETSMPYTFETEIAFFYEVVDIDLTYLCGAEKMVTFSSKKSIKKYVLYNEPTFLGNTSSLSNMDADYVVVPGCYSSNPLPDTMLWTLH